MAAMGNDELCHRFDMVSKICDAPRIDDPSVRTASTLLDPSFQFALGSLITKGDSNLFNLNLKLKFLLRRIKFSGFLTQQGFVRANIDQSMFIFNSPTATVVLLLYVNDIILTGNNASFIASLISKLSVTFAMEDLGELNYFLGIEANLTTSPDSTILTRTRYTLYLLTKADRVDSKPCNTPVTTYKRTLAHDGVFLSDPLQYRSLVGVLQYLTLTIPDITYTVNYVSQFMQAPRDSHMLLVKRILRYLKSKIGEGIILFTGDISSIHGYSDSDWAGCPDTHRST
ncbi:uncharacterized protein LOC113304994 [Papaver somniferum]|uniref:uncharacterized protein LOC113304994 n=1 Tax=Papaver somniferum TaxID=3469 RepID=UPI000E704152|nr:uncharacterized protein LOC113304994 [Papaver somniferum]